MFGSAALEVLIGIIFIFILVSIICSALREAIEAWLKTRAAYLEHGIRELLNDTKGTGLAKDLYNHPLVYGLFADTYKPGSTAKKPKILAGGGTLPSYIPSKNFAVALLDIAARGPETDEISSHPQAPLLSLDAVRTNIQNINNPFVQRALLTAIDTAQGDLNLAQKNIERWYDSAMDRVSGWYKRATHWVLFWIGLLVAILLNINTITIADYLFRSDAARSALVARAETAVRSGNTTGISYNEARAALDSLSLPIGWSAGWGAPRRQGENGYTQDPWNIAIAPILGLLITALAATMGAPFWFDLLNKVMVIRSTVKPHEKSPEEASEDRQMPKPQLLPALPAAPLGPLPAAPQAPTPTGGMAVANIRDAESSIDGCDVPIDVITTDEELPPAEGGVAP
jgi:hypothetical protein